MSLTLPLTLQPDALIRASELMTLFQACADKFGNITDSDIADGAAINGAKLATSSIPGDRLVPAGVGSTQLGVDAVLTANIKDWANGQAYGVTTAKLADAAATLAKIKFTTVSNPGTFSLVASSGAADWNTGVTTTGTMPLTFWGTVGTFSASGSLGYRFYTSGGVWMVRLNNFGQAGTISIGIGEIKFTYLS